MAKAEGISVRLEAHAAAAAASGKAGWLRAIAIPALEIACLIMFWQLMTLIIQSVFFPSPRLVLSSFWQLVVHGDIQGHGLFLHSWMSLLRVVKGFSLALLTAIPLGITFGLWGRIYDLGKILVEPVRFIPPLAWVPLAIIFMGGENRYTFIIWLGAFFPILITTMTGVQSMDYGLVEVGQVLGAGRWRVITKVVLPAVGPHMIAGARLGMGTGWACIVAAEMIGGESTGLGRMIVNYGELLQIDAVVVGMLAIGFLGYFLNEAFIFTEKKMFPWRKSARV